MEVENTDKTILRRLETIQAFANRQRPAVVKVTFMDGTTVTTDPSGSLDAFRAQGPSGGLQALHSNHPVFGPWAALLTTLCHPVADRRIENFE